MCASRRSTTLKLFPPAAPLKDVAMDLLGELLMTPRGNRYIIVITYRFSKLVRVIALANCRAIDVAKAFTRDWVFLYGPPVTVLTDNGPQFASQFLL